MKTIIKVALLLVIGVVTLGCFWLIYVGLYLGLEALFYATDPSAFPADQLRRISSIVLFLAYIGLLMTKTKPYTKAVLSTAPNAVMVITITLSYYQRPEIFLVLTSIFVGFQTILMRQFKASWYYYLALGLGALLGLLYAWPRPM